jgi:hypothetical protein
LVSLVVVDDLNVFRPSGCPSKADPPLLVDADAVVAGAITLELLKPIAWRDSEISDDISSIEDQKLS